MPHQPSSGPRWTCGFSACFLTSEKTFGSGRRITATMYAFGSAARSQGTRTVL